MEYIVVAVASIVGGAVLGYTSAANIGSPINRPMIFNTINPIVFIVGAFIVPAVLGYMSFGFLGILAALVVVWLMSVIIGSSIQGKF